MGRMKIHRTERLKLALHCTGRMGKRGKNLAIRVSSKQGVFTHCSMPPTKTNDMTRCKGRPKFGPSWTKLPKERQVVETGWKSTIKATNKLFCGFPRVVLCGHHNLASTMSTANSRMSCWTKERSNYGHRSKQ